MSRMRGSSRLLLLTPISARLTKEAHTHRSELLANIHSPASLGLRARDCKGRGTILQCPSQPDVPVGPARCKQSAGHSSGKSREARPPCALRSPRTESRGGSWTLSWSTRQAGWGAGQQGQGPNSPRTWAGRGFGLYRCDRAGAGELSGFLGRGRKPEASRGLESECSVSACVPPSPPPTRPAPCQ